MTHLHNNIHDDVYLLILIHLLHKALFRQSNIYMLYLIFSSFTDDTYNSQSFSETSSDGNILSCVKGHELNLIWIIYIQSYMEVYSIISFFSYLLGIAVAELKNKNSLLRMRHCIRLL